MSLDISTATGRSNDVLLALPQKENLLSGYEMNERMYAYTRAIFPLIKIWPTLGATRAGATFASRLGFKDSVKALVGMIKDVGYTFIKHRKIIMDLPKCDVLIAYTSKKPSWSQALEDIAIRLAGRGFTCATLHEKEIMITTIDGSGKTKQQSAGNIEQLLRYSVRRSDNLISFAASFFWVVALPIFLLVRNTALCKRMFARPVSLLQVFYNSRKRSVAMDEMLGKIKPKLIITNGDHAAFSSEIALSRKTENANKIWFFNESAHSGFLPIATDEMWVWNEPVAKYFIKSLLSQPKTKVTVVGRAEIDFALGSDKKEGEEEQALRKKMAHGNILLFLSQYSEKFPFDLGAITKEAIRWLVEAAQAHSDWWFIFKSRPIRIDHGAPGLKDALTLDNFVFPHQQIPFENFLAWENVRAVAALYSTGLHTAAGTGRVALRFSVSKKFTPDPAIDGVSTIINSPEHLIKAISDIENGAIEPNAPGVDDLNFPYHGRVMDRLENLSIDNLTSTKRSDAGISA